MRDGLQDALVAVYISNCGARNNRGEVLEKLIKVGSRPGSKTALPWQGSWSGAARVVGPRATGVAWAPSREQWGCTLSSGMTWPALAWHGRNVAAMPRGRRLQWVAAWALRRSQAAPCTCAVAEWALLFLLPQLLPGEVHSYGACAHNKDPEGGSGADRPRQKRVRCQPAC